MAAGSRRDRGAVIYSRKTVWRGFTAPRDHQLQALEQVRRLLVCLPCCQCVFRLRLGTGAWRVATDVVETGVVLLALCVGRKMIRN